METGLIQFGTSTATSASLFSRGIPEPTDNPHLIALRQENAQLLMAAEAARKKQREEAEIERLTRENEALRAELEDRKRRQ